MNKIITITLDTNCINAKQENNAMNILEKWHKEKLIKIVKTDAMDTEMKPYTSGINKSKNYSEDLGVGMFRHSRYRHCKYGRKKDTDIFERTRKILFPNESRSNLSPNKIKDIMHLRTHLQYKRDFFVSNDPHFINKQKQLEEKLNIRVRTPEEMICGMRDTLGNSFYCKIL